MGTHPSQVRAVPLMRAALLCLLLVLSATTQLSAQDAPNADQRIVLITGSTDGLGREVALRVSRTGALDAKSAR